MRRWHRFMIIWAGFYTLAGTSKAAIDVAHDQKEISPTVDGIWTAIQEFETAHPGRTLTIDALVARLPASFRAGFTLMYESRSIQPATFENPRVIMFGDDARIVLTFNGDPAQHGYDRLEMATVNQSTDEIEFRVINFPSGDSGQGQATISKANPITCMACHGHTPHYIWGQYAKWPGAYGSRDDILELTGDEKAKFLAFRAEAPQRARYRNLVYEFQAGSDNHPYRPREPGATGMSRQDFQIAFDYRPNARLGMLLMRHQARARARELLAVPDLDQKKYGFAFFLAGCASKFDSEWTDAVTKATGFDDYPAYAASLGQDPREAWHLTVGPRIENDQDYYAGLSTMRSAVLAAFWPAAFAGEPALAKGLVTARAGLIARGETRYRFAASPRGLALWDAIDRQGLIPTTFSGAEESDMYVQDLDLPRLSESDAKAVCTALAKAQLGQ